MVSHQLDSSYSSSSSLRDLALTTLLSGFWNEKIPRNSRRKFRENSLLSPAIIQYTLTTKVPWKLGQCCSALRTAVVPQRRESEVVVSPGLLPTSKLLRVASYILLKFCRFSSQDIAVERTQWRNIFKMKWNCKLLSCC